MSKVYNWTTKLIISIHAIYALILVTPESYVPPGFKHADNVIFNFEEDNINIRLGNVKTVC